PYGSLEDPVPDERQLQLAVGLVGGDADLSQPGQVVALGLLALEACLLQGQGGAAPDSQGFAGGDRSGERVEGIAAQHGRELLRAGKRVVEDGVEAPA